MSSSDEDGLTLSLSLPTPTSNGCKQQHPPPPPLPRPPPPSRPLTTNLIQFLDSHATTTKQPAFYEYCQMQIHDPAGLHAPFASPTPLVSPMPAPPIVPQRRSTRAPRNPIPNGKSEEIFPPFPWATDRRAVVKTYEALVFSGIHEITGRVQCRRCDHVEMISYDLKNKLKEVTGAITEMGDIMHCRAMELWLNPMYPACHACGQENSMRPLMAPKKRELNWLFMFLGQTLGVCTLEQLKYFCKHTRKHRTGAKNRLLYSAYMGIYVQLLPDEHFDEIF